MIFDSYDDPESKSTFSETKGTGPCAAFVRGRQTAAVAIGIIAKHGAGAKGLALMRKHIIGLDLAPERINRLRSFAASEARPHGHGYHNDRPDDAQVEPWNYKGKCNYAQWRRANFLVMQAALTVLLDVPVCGWSDARQFCELVQAWPGALPEDLQAKAVERVQLYSGARITGQAIRFDPSLTFTGEPWKCYRKDDLLVLAPAPARSVPLGRDYIFDGPADGKGLLQIGELRTVSRTLYVIVYRGEVYRLSRAAWTLKYSVVGRFPMRPMERAQQQPAMREAA